MSCASWLNRQHLFFDMRQTLRRKSWSSTSNAHTHTRTNERHRRHRQYDDKFSESDFLVSSSENWFSLFIDHKYSKVVCREKLSWLFAHTKYYYCWFCVRSTNARRARALRARLHEMRFYCGALLPYSAMNIIATTITMSRTFAYR